MTWFKVDDDLAFHRKVVAAGNASMGLWVRAGSWCAQHLTDGFIPDEMIGILGTPAQRSKLIKVGLWTEVPGGCQFHQWSENGRQPTAQSVREKRERAAERQAKHRAEMYANSQVNGGSHAVTNTSVTGTVTPLFTPAPTRPDPSSPNGELSQERKKPATRVPAAWRPTDKHRQYATEHGLNIDTQRQLFLAHAETHDRRCASWNGAFSQWLIKAAALPRQTRAVSGAPRPHQPYRNPTDDSVWDEPLLPTPGDTR